ncbi:MAG: tetratricopeptide repeat protein, partial [Desulfobacterales bacterium]|nr:tetratricopeptide repeat protein [Desulfobacterales bacterium]
AGEAFSKMTATHWLPVALLVFVCIVVYLNSLPNGFVFDDYAVIIENKYLKLPGINFASFLNHSYFNIAGGEASYRPLATLSYYLIYAIAGLNPFFYHLLSVILHIVNVVLVYLLFNLILKHRFTALIAGLLFACHPALTEAVDCISYNEDLLAAVFFLLAFLYYLKSSTNGLISNIISYGLSLFFFLLGLLSKEMAITLPAIILLYDVSLKNGVDKKSFSLQLILKNIKVRGLFYGGYLAVSLLYLSIRFFVLYHPQESIKPFYGNLFERIIFLPAHIFSFIKLAFFPVNLTADYVFSYPHHFFAASNLIGFLFVAGLAVGSVFIFKYSRGIFFGIWWFFITLFPVYNIIPIYNPFAERFLYIPLIGYCLLVAMAFNTLMNKRLSETVPVKVLSSVAIIALLSFYAMITIARNLDWKDSLTLWSKTVITSPDSSIAHGSLGRAYQDLGRLEEAIREYKKAIEIFPNNYKAYYNLGVLYDGQGALKEAVANYKRTIAINPAFIDAQFNLGNIYHNQGLLEEAIQQYRKVTELDPADFEARNNLGVAYARRGKFDQAIAQWEKVLEIEPQNKSAGDNIKKAKEMME